MKAISNQGFLSELTVDAAVSINLFLKER